MHNIAPAEKGIIYTITTLQNFLTSVEPNVADVPPWVLDLCTFLILWYVVYHQG